MRVYLIQHGESKSEEEDPQRRLTDKGIGEVQKIADFLRPLKFAVDTVFGTVAKHARSRPENCSRRRSGPGIVLYSAKVLVQKTRLPQRKKRSNKPVAT